MWESILDYYGVDSVVPLCKLSYFERIKMICSSFYFGMLEKDGNILAQTLANATENYRHNVEPYVEKYKK